MNYEHMTKNELMHYGSLDASTPLEKALIKLAKQLADDVAHLEQMNQELEYERYG